MDPSDYQYPSGRRPMDVETAIALVFLAIALLLFGGFGLMILGGMFALSGH